MTAAAIIPADRINVCLFANTLRGSDRDADVCIQSLWIKQTPRSVGLFRVARWLLFLLGRCETTRPLGINDELNM